MGYENGGRVYDSVHPPVGSLKKRKPYVIFAYIVVPLVPVMLPLLLLSLVGENVEISFVGLAWVLAILYCLTVLPVLLLFPLPKFIAGYIRHRAVRTKLRITPESLERFSEKTEEVVALREISRLRVVRDTEGAISEIRVFAGGGKRLLLRGFEKMEEILSTLKEQAQIQKEEESRTTRTYGRLILLLVITFFSVKFLDIAIHLIIGLAATWCSIRLLWFRDISTRYGLLLRRFEVVSAVIWICVGISCLIPAEWFQ